MSPIGRAFILVNLVLAAIFVGYSGFYLQQQESFKQQLDTAVAAHDKSKRLLEGEISALTSLKESLNNDLAVARKEIQTTTSELSSSKQANLDMRNRLSQLESDYKEINGSLKIFNSFSITWVLLFV